MLNECETEQNKFGFFCDMFQKVFLVSGNKAIN